jgi:hypothetical protein
MLYFATSTIHRCRHQHCKRWLKPPATDPRDAFCSARCCESFYRLHCRVCERPIVSRNSRRQVCDRPKCQGQFQRHRGLFFGTLYPDGPVSAKPEKSSTKSTSKSTIKSDRPSPQVWHRIAGPKVSAATLDPVFAASNARANNKHWNRAALLGLNDPPVNVLGGYKFPGTPKIELTARSPAISTVPSSWEPTWSPLWRNQIDLPIPDFLRRRLPDRGAS